MANDGDRPQPQPPAPPVRDRVRTPQSEVTVQLVAARNVVLARRLAEAESRIGRLEDSIDVMADKVNRAEAMAQAIGQLRKRMASLGQLVEVVQTGVGAGAYTDQPIPTGYSPRASDR